MGVEVEKRHLTELVKKLSQWERMPYTVLGVIQHEIRCTLNMQFYVNSLSSPSAIVIFPDQSVNFSFLRRAVFVDAINKHQLYQLLRSSPIDWTSEFRFFGAPLHLLTICQQAASFHGNCALSYRMACFIKTAKSASNPATVLPEKYIMTSLKVDDIKEIIDTLDYAEEFGIQEISNRLSQAIQHHPNVAIREKKSMKLVGYETTSPHGTMSMLCVDPKHRGQGLGSILVAELSRLMIANNITPVAHLEETNMASLNIHLKAGFRNVQCQIGIFTYKPRNTT